MMTACLPRSFSSDFGIKAADCFCFTFFSLQTVSLLLSFPLSTITFFQPSLFHLCVFLFSFLPTFLSLFIYVFGSSPLLSSSLSMCVLYMFVKIYRSPVVPSHSHACSVSLSYSIVHKKRSLWLDIKEKGGKKKRIFFCFLTKGCSDLACSGLTFDATPFRLAFCFSFALVTSDTKAILSPLERAIYCYLGHVLTVKEI